VQELNVNVDPLITGTPAVSAHDCRKFPAVEASQMEMWEIVSDAVIEKLDSVDSAIEPPEAADQTIALRVVTAEAFVVPAAPGSPVWSLMNGVATAAAAVLR
jgi:hypothetical protein